MIRSSTEKDFPKQEAGVNDGKNTKGPCSSRPWSGFKDPRVVRVSRSFGGKDRHSKVCTIRGLRDRRVRLSVSTAIQLYDLQDRLGLTQPSKVVDWLLNAAQDDIDKLPPLQMLPEHFIQYPQPLAVPQAVVAPQQAPSISLLGANTDLTRSAGATLVSTKGNAKSSSYAFVEDPKSTNCNADAHFRAKCKEVRREMGSEKSNEIMPVLNSFARPSHSLLSNAMPYTSYYQWDLAANASVPHLAGLGFSSQVEEIHHRNSASIQSSDSLPSASQLLLYPSGTAPSIFPSLVGTPMDGDPKQINHFQMLSSNSQNPLTNPIATSLFSINPTMRPFPLNLTPMYHHSPNNHERQSNPLHKVSSISTSNVGTANSFQKDSKSTTFGSNPPSFL